MQWQPPKFDNHQFAGRKRSVYARYTPQGWETSGLGFSDFSWYHHGSGAGNMHTVRRKQRQERRLDTPSWAVNDGELCEVILKFCERRVLMSRNPAHVAAAAAGLTQTERIDRIRQIELKRATDCERNLMGLRERWKSEPEARKPQLEIQIGNMDTQLRFLRLGNLAIAAGVVYLYYRLGYTSVEVAQELKIKPPHVRQILARLHNAASGVVYRSPNPKWERIRQFQAELRRIKKLWKLVKRVTERKSAREQLRTIKDGIVKPKSGRRGTLWTREKILFIHFHLLKGLPRETVAKKLGIQRADSMMTGYRYFLANPQKLPS